MALKYYEMNMTAKSAYPSRMTINGLKRGKVPYPQRKNGNANKNEVQTWFLPVTYVNPFYHDSVNNGGGICGRHPVIHNSFIPHHGMSIEHFKIFKDLYIQYMNSIQMTQGYLLNLAG